MDWPAGSISIAFFGFGLIEVHLSASYLFIYLKFCTHYPVGWYVPDLQDQKIKDSMQIEPNYNTHIYIIENSNLGCYSNILSQGKRHMEKQS